MFVFFFFFSSRRRHTRSKRDWSSDVCSSDLYHGQLGQRQAWHRDSRQRQPGNGEPWGVEAADADAVQVERSEERRVGKECRWRGGGEHYKEIERRIGIGRDGVVGRGEIRGAW